MKYLFNENPLVIDVSLASELGLNEAIILQQMHYWLKKSNHLIDGKKWIYNSIAEWKKQFPFLSESTINRTIKGLESKGILFVGNYNKDRRDRTKWYSINHQELDAIMKNAFSQNEECILSECTNANSQNDQMHQVNLTKPLPETTTETTTDNKKINKKRNLNNYFEIFWKAGLVKINKSKAQTAFLKAFDLWALKTKGSIDEFVEMLSKDIGARLSVRQFGFESLHPATYLNNARWEDDLIVNKAIELPKREVLNFDDRSWVDGLENELWMP